MQGLRGAELHGGGVPRRLGLLHHRPALPLPGRRRPRPGQSATSLISYLVSNSHVGVLMACWGGGVVHPPLLLCAQFPPPPCPTPPHPTPQIPTICNQLLPSNSTDLFISRACPPALGCYSLGAAVYEIDPETKEAGGSALAKVSGWMSGYLSACICPSTMDLSSIDRYLSPSVHSAL